MAPACTGSVIWLRRGPPARQPSRLLAGFLLSLGILLSGTAQAADARSRFLAYHETWSEARTSEAARTRLANLPPYVGTVTLAFARPDMSYRGGLALGGTGLTPPFAGTVLREAIALRRARAPGSRVLLGLGGATYGRWDGLDAAAVGRLVRDLGLDGVQIDYEPSHAEADCRPAGTGAAARMRCASDARFVAIVETLRGVLPRPLVLGLDGIANGAYGEGRWRDAPPVTPYTGSALAVLRSHAAGKLDFVAIMGYDAGPNFRAIDAYAAYRAVWPGPLALGLLVPPDHTGGSITIAEAERRVRHVADDPAGLIMLYTLQARPPGPIGYSNPDATLLATTICRILGAARCNASLP